MFDGAEIDDRITNQEIHMAFWVLWFLALRGKSELESIYSAPFLALTGLGEGKIRS